MATLYNRIYNRREILSRVGDISQIARIKPYRLTEGQEDGVQALDVSTGSGFGFTILPSRGMDISAAQYCGRSLAWRSPTGDTHPALFDHEGEGGRGWLRSFYGGLVVTCGLTYAGANGEDAGQTYGLHGRISNLAATNVQQDAEWQGDEYVLTVRGKMRQATVFGENLLMTRTITTRLGDNHFTLHDTVENLGVTRTEHMMLYHVNIGFPVVDAGARLVSPTEKSTPRDADAVTGEASRFQFQAPEAGFREQVYFHDLAPNPEGTVTTAIVNEACHYGDATDRGLGVYVTFRPEQLPRFIEWKMMDSGTYVVGMEPANCLVMGRAKEREAGILQFLEPGEQREYSLEIGALVGSKSIAAHERQCLSTVRSAGDKQAAP